MVIALKNGVSRAEAEALAAGLEKQGVTVDFSEGASQIVLGLVGDTTVINDEVLRANRLVETVIRVQEPYKRANRKFHPADTVLELPGADGNARIGGDSFAVIAGPCSVESREQITLIARAVKKAGAGFLRGGACGRRLSFLCPFSPCKNRPKNA